MPQNEEEVKIALQDSLMALVQKTLPIVDYDLPPGWPLLTEEAKVAVEPDEELPPEEIARGDREMASAIMMMMKGFKLDKTLCVAFRNDSYAKAAMKRWKKWGLLINNIISFQPSASAKVAIGAPLRPDFLTLARQAREKGCSYLALVAPKAKELQLAAEFIEELGDSRDMCIVFLNARLRSKANVASEVTELRAKLAQKSLPAFHMRFVGAKEQAAVYRSINEKAEGTPWVILRRPQPGEQGPPQELWRGDTEPSLEELKAALANI